MRNFLAVLAAVGCVLIAVGIFYALTWAILAGAVALLVAVVMAALAAPRTRRGR